MRRFLDWTAGQTAGQFASSNRRNSHHGQTLDQTVNMSQQYSAKDLELQHLMKLLHDIKYYQASSSPLPTASGLQNQKEFVDKVHRTLPLFLNVFGTSVISPHATTINPTFALFTSGSCKSSNERLDSHCGSAGSSKPNSPLPPPRSPPMDKFPDLLPFAFTVARLFVSEVRQRASNKHAEEASSAILQFFYTKPNPNAGDCSQQEDSSTNQGEAPGWNLLLSLTALVLSQNSQIIQLLCDASLPSTLIKCLYLFFDLPAPGDKDLDSDQPQTENNLPSRDLTNKSPLIKTFTQLLVQLCFHQSSIDELIKKDDLRLLIGIASSQCTKHNRPWRNVAFQTLIAISKSMRDNFIYLEQNNCIQAYVENMLRINSLGLVSVDELVDMIKIMLEFLYNLDVNNRNQPRCIYPLVEQFKASRIVDLIEELILKIDETILQEDQNGNPTQGDLDSAISHQQSISSEVSNGYDEYRRSGRRLIQSLTLMAKINTSQDGISNISTLKPLSTSRFNMFEQFKMPRPTAKNCVLNYEAIRLLKMGWSKCKDIHIIEAILDATISLFNDDRYNYFIFESQQLLVYYMTSSEFKLFPYKVKQKLFKFLEFIVIETNYIPCLELGTLGSMMKQTDTSDADLVLVLRTLIACLRFNARFSDIFRELGILDIIIDLLSHIMQQDKLKQVTERLEILYLLLETSQYLLTGPNNLNCSQFNESGAARYVFNCLSQPEFFHLFIPVHSSSSDDSAVLGPASQNSTPPPSAHTRSQTPSSLCYSYYGRSELSLNHLRDKPSMKQVQKVSFTILRQLILSSTADEHLANLLGLLARNLDDLKHFQIERTGNESDEESKSRTSKLTLTYLISQEVNLKICILKSLMIILKDSHRCRTLFRKAGGFTYLVSSLVTLEKSLPPAESRSGKEVTPRSLWSKINTRRIWRLIRHSLMTIVVAMRYEPANLRSFSRDVLSKFTNAIKNLGCFVSSQKRLPESGGILAINSHIENFTIYKSIFLAPLTRDFSTIANDDLRPDEACCQLFRFLYDMALDMADNTIELESHLEKHGPLYRAQQQVAHGTKSISFDQETFPKESGVLKRRSQLAPKRPPSLDLAARSVGTVVLTFPSIAITILDLIPACPTPDLIVFICMVTKSLFQHERNQQMLCEAGVISKLLSLEWQVAIVDQSHFLHQFAQYMFATLTKQAITTKELRMFMRLHEPLRCKNLDEIGPFEDDTGAEPTDYSSSKEKISTHRIKSLVAMMNDGNTRPQPPFVEFDMSLDGFSSIFMPSIAPINARALPQNSSTFLNSTLDIHTTEKNGILGGVGSQERQFPPMSGLTFATWIRIERFPTRSNDATHNLRLLTIYRGSATTGKEFSCFRIQISALDRALTVSTQEALLFENDNRSEAQHDPDCNIRLWTPELLVEGRWHHIAITMNRSMMKQSTAHIYIDGILVHSQRICYISNHVGIPNSGPLGNPDPSSAGVSAAAFVNAFIGSLPQLRLQLNTHFKQGPCHLVEEPLSPGFIGAMYALGPFAVGNFQSSYRLQDLSKVRLTKANFEKTQQQSDIWSHKPIAHQQSAAVMGSSPNHNALLTRVQSSNIGSSSSQPSGGSHSNYNLSEDHILLSLDARATSLMTLSRMRRIYTRFDCRQVSRVLGIALQENSTPILVLHNTGVHLNGTSRGLGAITIGYNHVRVFVPSPTQETLFNLGGSYILLGLVAQAQTVEAFSYSLEALVCALKYNINLQAQMDSINGYQLLSVFFWRKKHLLNHSILKMTLSLVTDCPATYPPDQESSSREIHQVIALRDLVCECFDLWLHNDMIIFVLEFIYDLISSTNQDQSNLLPLHAHTRIRNLKNLRDMDLLPRMLRLLPQYDSPLIEARLTEDGIKDFLDKEKSLKTYDAKAVYLIKQTVFELLNRTPRQADILHFGQFLASLLPSSNKEKPARIISLRNILLKSLFQMLTKNKQDEINNAMQEELVRILGFDWFMLFINGSHLDQETITIGFLNLMVILSNEDLYSTFKSKVSNNGGWLKEPAFSSIDGKFNIQLLGVNVGVFLGINSKKKSIKREILEAPNFFLLGNCLTSLISFPRIYLMIFQTMMNRLSKIDGSVLDSLESFDKLNLDLLCDCLVGDTHHKRRQTLANTQLKCHELVVCLVYMLRDIIWQPDANKSKQPDSEVSRSENLSNLENYPADLTRFLMYLYNNNKEFQYYCRRSDELIMALSETLMRPDYSSRDDEQISANIPRSMTDHPALKEILELSQLIILDNLTDISQVNEISGVNNQMHAFEYFLETLSSCREAQGELVEMLLRQVLLMIDSTARHNSIKTISSSENVLQFQLLLTNSITVSQIVTDKIWLLQLYTDNLSRATTIIDHQLCLAEQIFKFNELLPKHNPPHAFIMQRTLNRIILFALSRPMQHMSDKMLMLDLLKKIYDNRTIIILNHMHSPQSAEFFVCFVYCLMKIIEDNSPMPISAQHSIATDQPSSLIERQYGHLNYGNRGSVDNNVGGSSALLLVSIARKIWDAIYQSKKGVLSEAFDISLSLPAFTLETSLDLLQLKSDINESCERFWAAYIESEQKPKRRLLERQGEPAPGTTTSSAVNILSGRLTRVVNAASFVSRVVGATAGTMASNVNLVGEKLSQSRNTKRDLSQRTSDVQSGGSNNQMQSGANQPSSLRTNQIKLFKCSGLARFQVVEATQKQISIIEECIESQLSQGSHKLSLHKYLCDEWYDIEQEILLRERAVFGPDYESKLDKWCLDLTEGPRRMRKKMVNNSKQFYENYPYRAEQYNPDNKSLRYRPPMSLDSYSYHMKTVKLDKQLLEPDDKPMDEKESKPLTPDDVINQTSSTLLDPLLKLETEHLKSPEIKIDSPSPIDQELEDHHSSNESLLESTTRYNQDSAQPHSDIDMDDGDSTSFVDFSPEIEAETNSARDSENIDSLSVLRLLEKNERISHMFRCSRVQGLDTHEGLLLFGREHFYLIDGFTLLKTREIKDIDSLPPDAHDPIIPNSTPNILASSKKTCAKFSFDGIVEVHKRRYLLQPIALEVFSTDGRNALIAFPRNIRNKVYSRLMTVATQITSNVHESLAGQKSNVNIEGGSGLLSNLIGETSVTQRWVRGELSNFQYLMNLNTIAGRSYNDLMQYPIFPWIIADYSSDYLDLNRPSTFRDLSRPVGAQTSDRLEQFKRRYAEWDDTETPPYHYGTFYSSAMIVASYMVRMEPFTQHFLRLQGGHFDLADRMFHSIHDSWLSASKHNMADIKELVPEFFYLPEFLKNQNRYDLGLKQSGMRLDDVILPRWAKNDTREFIRLHRSALESDYVSAHLNEWIDLIFGYKQQGQAAVDAVNVFHHLFYEGNVDIYNTDIDPIKKNAVIGFINNFGQVPKQLFKKPHPVRKVMSSNPLAGAISTPLTPILPSLSGSSGSSMNQRTFTHYAQGLRLTNYAFKDLRGPVGQIVQIDKNIVAVEQNKLLIPPEYCRYVAWGYADRSLRLGLYDSEKPVFVWERSEIMPQNEILCCTIPNNRTMITAGTESLITVWKIEKMRSFTPLFNLYGHIEPVTCLASSQSYSLVVSGSRDRTAIVWDLNRFTLIRQLGGGPTDKLVHKGPVSAIAINDSTGDIATCASSWLYLWTINGELLANIDSLSAIVQQSLCGSSSISNNLGQLHILSVCFSQCNEWDLNEVIVTGASDGSVALWSMRYYQKLIEDAQVDLDKSTKQDSCSKEEPDDEQDEEEGEEEEGMKEDYGDRAETPSAAQGKRSPDNEYKPKDETDTISSEPININGRQRTDTINSEWVRLSTSSNSTAAATSVDNVPVMKTTSDDQVDVIICSSTGGESFGDPSSVLASTPISSADFGEFQQTPGGNRDLHLNELNDCSQDTCDGQAISKGALFPIANDPSCIKFSKSDTSLTDSFVMLGDTIYNQGHSGNSRQSSDRIRPQSSAGPHSPRKGERGLTTRGCDSSRSPSRDAFKLLPNHQWERELYLRVLLPRRTNNKTPPTAVTALAISKDHKAIYIGEANGKITSWST